MRMPSLVSAFASEKAVRRLRVRNGCQFVFTGVNVLAINNQGPGERFRIVELYDALGETLV